MIKKKNQDNSILLCLCFGSFVLMGPGFFWLKFILFGVLLSFWDLSLFPLLTSGPSARSSSYLRASSLWIPDICHCPTGPLLVFATTSFFLFIGFLVSVALSSSSLPLLNLIRSVNTSQVFAAVDRVVCMWIFHLVLPSSLCVRSFLSVSGFCHYLLKHAFYRCLIVFPGDSSICVILDLLFIVLPHMTW